MEESFSNQINIFSNSSYFVIFRLLRESYNFVSQVIEASTKKFLSQPTKIFPTNRFSFVLNLFSQIPSKMRNRPPITIIIQFRVPGYRSFEQEIFITTKETPLKSSPVLCNLPLIAITVQFRFQRYPRFEREIFITTKENPSETPVPCNPPLIKINRTRVKQKLQENYCQFSRSSFRIRSTRYLVVVFLC